MKMLLSDLQKNFLEKIEADKDKKSKNDIPDDFYKRKRSVGRPRKNSGDTKPMYIMVLHFVIFKA